MTCRYTLTNIFQNRSLFIAYIFKENEHNCVSFILKNCLLVWNENDRLSANRCFWPTLKIRSFSICLYDCFVSLWFQYFLLKTGYVSGCFYKNNPLSKVANKQRNEGALCVCKKDYFFCSMILVWVFQIVSPELGFWQCNTRLSSYTLRISTAK